MFTTSQNPAQERVQRYDAGFLRPSHTTDEGFLVCEAFVARPGVYEYVQPDGSIVRELIPTEELHRADSLGTLALKPVTLEHPPEDVTPDNYERYAVGEVGHEVTVVEGGYVKVVMTAKRRDAIEALKRGIQETSPGYTCRIEESAGVDLEFGAYDRIQRDRRYNHKAITERARGGPTIHARVDGAIITAPVRGAYQRRTDSLFDPLPELGEQQSNTPRNTMTEEQIKRIVIAAMAEGSKRQDSDDKYDALSKKVDQLASKMDQFMKPKSKKDGDEDEEEDGEEKEKFTKKKKDSTESDFKTLYLQRKRLETLAATHRVDSKKVDELDNAELAKTIVLQANPKARQDGDERYYIDALDFIEEQSTRQDSASSDPYRDMNRAFDDHANNSQQRQDSNNERSKPASAGWLERANEQFKNRHAS